MFSYRRRQNNERGALAALDLGLASDCILGMNFNISWNTACRKFVEFRSSRLCYKSRHFILAIHVQYVTHVKYLSHLAELFIHCFIIFILFFSIFFTFLSYLKINFLILFIIHFKYFCFYYFLLFFRSQFDFLERPAAESPEAAVLSLREHQLLLSDPQETITPLGKYCPF